MESTKTPPPIMNQSKQLTEEIGSSKLLTEASRRFYELPVDGTSTSNQTLPNRGDDLFKFIADNVSGKNTTFKGPFGHRKTLYCDYTASGKSLNFIEDYVRDQVLPSYANTHTTTTITALQTTLFRHEARDIIRNAVNATEEDALVFVGSGCTGAVHKLINVMSLQNPPIVFVGPYEHHSNLLPWREIATRVIRINETNNGLVDINHLHVELEQWKSSGRQLIGCFSAASNVTGVMADVDAIAIELHNANALAFFDYATAAPYLEINMNPKSSKGFAHKDAIYFSTHKFVGGVQAPGILVAKKKLFRNAYPTTGGGGTVFYVRRTAHRYLRDIETREEGGTPAIVESIRAGLVFRLKEVTGAQNILEKEHLLVKKAFEKLSRENCPNMILLGPLDQVERLPIFSFMIHNRQTGRLLHYNYVGALLNDVFGIQSRGGCACAGPYAEDLLGIDEDLAEIYENLLLEDSRLDKEFSDKEAFRPGFSRLNLAYFFDEPTVDFILEALRLVAEHGWKLLPQYNLNTHTGEWRHKDNLVFKERVWLSNLNFSPKKHVKARCASKEAPNYTETLIEAQYIFDNYEQYVKTSQPNYNNAYDLDTNQFRWFMTPSDAVRCIKQPSNTPLFKLPFTPAVYPLKIKPEIVLSNVESECEIQEMITKIKNKKLSSHEMMKGNQLKDRMKIDNNNIAGIVKRETKNKLGIASKTFNTNKDNQLLTPDKVSKCEVKAIDNTVKISHNVQWHSPSKDVFKRSVEKKCAILQRPPRQRGPGHFCECWSSDKGQAYKWKAEEIEDPIAAAKKRRKENFTTVATYIGELGFEFDTSIMMKYLPANFLNDLNKT